MNPPNATSVLAGESGRICGLAIDHVGSLDAILAGGDAGEFKRSVVGALSSHASCVLVDEAHAGLLAGLPGPILGLDDDDPPSAIARMVGVGAAVVKGHLFCGPTLSPDDDDRVEAWGVACAAAGVPFLFEPLVGAGGDRRHEVEAVCDHFAAARFGIDVLKVQLPIDHSVRATPEDHADAHRRLDAACGTIPHVFLSGGIDTHASFVRLLRAATDVGSRAVGVVVGRAVWGGVASRPAAERPAALVEAAERMRALRDLVDHGFRSIGAP